MSDVLAALPYAVAAWVLLVGCYGIATSRSFIHSIVCLSLVQSSTCLLLLLVGWSGRATAPVFGDVRPGVRVVDPLVQALTLTDIVVGAAVTALLATGDGHASADAIDSLFRDAHTIKGGAGMLGLLEIVLELTHQPRHHRPALLAAGRDALERAVGRHEGGQHARLPVLASSKTEMQRHPGGPARAGGR